MKGGDFTDEQYNSINLDPDTLRINKKRTHNNNNNGALQDENINKKSRKSEQINLPLQRVWPRPRKKCPECNCEMVLRWGEINRPHFSHIGRRDESRECKEAGETEFHKMAKNVLATLINQGTEIKVKKTACGVCRFKEVDTIQICGSQLKHTVGSKSDPTTLTRENQSAIVEKPIYGGIADIAIFGNGIPSVIFEILVTHRTIKRPCVWYEINAIELIKSVGKRDLENINTIELECRRERPKCSAKDCFTTRELAVKLGYGYFWQLFTNEDEVDQANRGVNNFYGFEFSTSDDYDEDTGRHNNILWSLFLKRKECMACKKKWNTSKYKPFCLTCFKSMKKDNDLIVDDGPFGNKLVNRETAREDLITNHLQRLPDQDLKILRDKYRFLDCVPKYDRTVDTSCFHCRKWVYHNHLPATPYWMGAKRRICGICFKKYKKIVAKNISMPNKKA